MAVSECKSFIYFGFPANIGDGAVYPGLKISFSHIVLAGGPGRVYHRIVATECDCNRREFLRGSLAVAACCKLPDMPPAGVRIEPGLVRIDLNQAPELRRVSAALQLADPDRKLYLIVAHP